MGADDPNTDDEHLFDDDCLDELADILGVKGDPRIVALGDELRAFGLQRRNEIRSMPIGYPIAPIDASLTQRAQWLVTNVIRPIERLQNALSEENEPYFSEWPDYGYLPERPANSEVLLGLRELHLFASRMRDWLEGQIEERAPHTVEMRYDTVGELFELLSRHFPEIAISRGHYDKELGVMVGRVPDFVRRAYFEITSSHEQLDAPIKIMSKGF